MSVLSQIEMYENHPLYREILKTILKSQIQTLVDQLSTQIGEETVILSASIKDGNITDIGTQCGREFLKGYCDIKREFLGFCMKRHYERQSGETAVIKSNKSNYEKSRPNNEILSRLQASPLQALSPKPNNNRGKRKHGSYDTSMQEWEASGIGSYDLSTNNGPQKEYSDAQMKHNPLEDSYSQMESPRFDEDQDGQSVKSLSDSIIQDTCGKSDDGTVPIKKEVGDPPLSLQEQITSKRKQKAPKRMKLEDADPGYEATNLATDSSSNPVYEDEEGIENDRKLASHEFAWSVDRISDLNASPLGRRRDENGYFPDEYRLGTNLVGNMDRDPAFWGYESANYDLAAYNARLHNRGLSSEDASYSQSLTPDAKDSKNHVSSNNLLSELNNAAGNNSPMKHVVDGVLVSRGSGRLEKLLKCELCGKVCRTSNMARHKKRYCLGYPKVRLLGNSADFKGNPILGNSSDFKGVSPEFRGIPTEFKGNSTEFRGIPTEFKGNSTDLKGNYSDFIGNSSEFKRVDISNSQPLDLITSPQSSGV